MNKKLKREKKNLKESNNFNLYKKCESMKKLYFKNFISLI